MSVNSERAYGGISVGDRVALRRLRLIDTTIELMAASEWRSATVDSVCRAAGLNKRYFYESFEDLDELASATVNFVAENLRERSDEADLPMRDASLEERIRAAVTAIVGYFVADPRQARVMYGPVSASAAVTRSRAMVTDEATRRFVEVGREVHGDPPGSDLLARTSAAFIVGGTGQAVLDWLDNHAGENPGPLIDDLSALWLIIGYGASAEAHRRLDR